MNRPRRARTVDGVDEDNPVESLPQIEQRQRRALVLADRNACCLGLRSQPAYRFESRGIVVRERVAEPDDRDSVGLHG